MVCLMENPFISILKEIFDKTIAIVALIILSPLFMVISVLIKLDSPGPVLFVQERAGLKGKIFNSTKFRTMMHKAAECGLGLNVKDGDERITSVGRFLRAWSLDELPQLINVLKGEMSIVGPRPPIPSEVDKYDLWQRRRLSMKPGMTCLWQTAHNRNEVRFEDWMNLDLQYIDNWSLKLDFVILLKTIGVVLSGEGR